MQTPEDNDVRGGSLPRRTAIKVGAAVAVGSVVWAEPTIKGLATRPAYAAAGSTPTVYTIQPVAEFRFGNGASGTGLPTTIAAPAPVMLVLTGPLADGSHDNGMPMGTYTLTATVAGCTCTWDAGAAASIIFKRGTGTPVAGMVSGNTITWNWTGTQIANRFEITAPITLTCV